MHEVSTDVGEGGCVMFGSWRSWFCELPVWGVGKGVSLVEGWILGLVGEDRLKTGLGGWGDAGGGGRFGVRDWLMDGCSF